MIVICVATSMLECKMPDIICKPVAFAKKELRFVFWNWSAIFDFVFNADFWSDL